MNENRRGVYYIKHRYITFEEFYNDVRNVWGVNINDNVFKEFEKMYQKMNIEQTWKNYYLFLVLHKPLIIVLSDLNITDLSEIMLRLNRIRILSNQ